MGVSWRDMGVIARPGIKGLVGVGCIGSIEMSRKGNALKRFSRALIFFPTILPCELTGSSHRH